MSSLNPLAPSFPGGGYGQPNANNNSAGYNSNSNSTGNGLMSTEGYGGGPAMYEHANGYQQGGNGNGGGGRGGYGGGYGSGSGNMGGNYGNSAGYGNNAPPPQPYAQGPRMGRQNMRGPMSGHGPYQNPNGGMMGGTGGGNMRAGGQFRGNAVPYYSNGAMDMPGGYEQQPPQHMPMQQPHPMRANNNMGMSNNMIGSNRMPPHAYNSGMNPPRGLMPGVNPNLGIQGGMMSGNTSAPPPPPASPPAVTVPPMPAPSYTVKIHPRVVMVVGYKQTGKTTVAHAIADKEGFEYVCLRPSQDSDSEDTAKAEVSTLVERLAPLCAVLEKKATLKGIVIDDAFSTNRFEAHYVLHYLTKAGLQLDAVVALLPELSVLVKRRVDFSSSHDRMVHPEPFEFASALDENNVVVLSEEMSLRELVSRATADVAALLETDAPAVTLAAEEFIPDCPLVTDPELAEEILAAERAAVKRDLPFKFAYSEPNFVMEYMPFVQNAEKLQHYLVTPWLWGDKVSLIGYGGDVYVHLTSYNLVFQLNDLPTTLQELVKKLRSEAEASGAEADKPESRVLFTVEASMLDDVIYISDMMLIGKQHGDEMILHDRVKLLSECFGTLPTSGPVRLLEHYNVSDLKDCLRAHGNLCRGAIFVNPDGVQCGRYDVRNFIYPSETKKTVRVRIWDGHLVEDKWSFSGYVRDEDEEVLASNASTGQDTLSVFISDAAVDENTINDGNVVECVMEKPAPKGKSRDKTAFLSFCRRCKWEQAPITLFFMWAFSDPPRWSTESFMDACSTIAGVRPVV